MWKSVIFVGLLMIASTLIFMASCSEDDDDNDDGTDDAADDTSDDDATDDTDDADDAEHPCEVYWDVIIEGDYADDFDWVTTWTTKYTIDSANYTDGIVIPDAAGWETYEAIGVIESPGVGWSEGSFTTPEDLADYCDSTYTQIRVEYTIDGQLFQGQATYHCPDELGPYTIFGTVTCGTP